MGRMTQERRATDVTPTATRNEGRGAIAFLRRRIENGHPLYPGDVDSALAEARQPLLEEIGSLRKSLRILDESLASERRNVVEQVRSTLADRLLEGQRHQRGAVYVDGIEEARLYAEWLLADSIATGTEEEGK